MRTLIVEANEDATKYFANGGESAKDLSNRIMKKYKNNEFGNGFKISGFVGEAPPVTFTIYYDDYDGCDSDNKAQINKLDKNKNNHYISKICIGFNKGDTYKYAVFLKNKDIRVFNKLDGDLMDPSSEWYFALDYGDKG